MCTTLFSKTPNSKRHRALAASIVRLIITIEITAMSYTVPFDQDRKFLLLLYGLPSPLPNSPTIPPTDSCSTPRSHHYYLFLWNTRSFTRLDRILPPHPPRPRHLQKPPFHPRKRPQRHQIPAFNPQNRGLGGVKNREPLLRVLWSASKRSKTGG